MKPRISAAATDAVINQAVAETQGWHRADPANPIIADRWFNADESEVRLTSELPNYATSADCVLPFVVSHGATVQWSYPSELPERPRHCLVQVFTTVNGETNMFEADAPTFARAACLSLLAAHGFEITP